MRHDMLLFVLVPLYLIVVAALLVYEIKPVATDNKAPAAIEDKATAIKEEKPDPAPQSTESIGKPSLKPGCEKELRHTVDLLRFFGNRIQMGEEPQSVVADMRQQERKISAVCD
jgi:hypothetical protein